MPYLLQPDSGGNCCDCPDRETPCEDCAPCPRDITDLSSVTLETTIEVTDDREPPGCSFSYSETQSKTWNRIDRFDADGNVIAEPGDYEFQIWWGNDVGHPACDIFNVKVGGPAWPPDTQEFDGATFINALPTSVCVNDGALAAGSAFFGSDSSLFYLSGFVTFGCASADPACDESDNIAEDPFNPDGAATIAELIGSYTLEETHDTAGGTSGNFHRHLKTVVTIA